LIVSCVTNNQRSEIKKENFSLAQKEQKTEKCTSFNDAVNCEICIASAEGECKMSAEY